MSPKKKILCLVIFGIHALTIASYNLICMKSYEKPAVFNQLSSFGQSTYNYIKPIIPNGIPYAARIYAHAAGINTGYCLFAPNVPSGTSIIFELSNDEGDTIVRMPQMNSKEGMDRFNGNYSTYNSFEEIRELLAYGWAVRMLELNPGYNQITVVIGAHRMPTMEDFRNGKEPHFEEAVRYNFSLQ